MPSSISSEMEENIVEFHIIGELGNGTHYKTDKAVSLSSGKPLVIKYFKTSEKNKAKKLVYLQSLLADLKSNTHKCSSLMKYYDFRLDEETNQIIMIQEHSNKMIDFEYHIKNYGYIEESKLKIIAFQVIKAVRALSNIERSHGKLSLSNIFISNKFKVKVTDYWINNDNFKRSHEDGMVIDIFNLGVWLLKILGLARIEENIDFYSHDKRTLRNHYKHVDNWKLRNFLDTLLIKKYSNLDLIELHPYLQITEDDIQSLSKFSKDSSITSEVTNSVKWDFTFQSQSDKETQKENTTETDIVDPKLQKFLTNTSETTSYNYEYEGVPPSLVPVVSELPPIDTRGSKRMAQAFSVKDDKSLTDLDSKLKDDNSFSSETSSAEPIGELINQQNINEVVENVNKRMSRINFPGVRIGRLSKDDFEKEYQKELFALAKIYDK